MFISFSIIEIENSNLYTSFIECQGLYTIY